MPVSGKKILIADDDLAIVEVVTMVLEDEGYQVDAHTCGIDASTIAKLAPLPDLILMDIWMSGVDGSVVVKTLKKRPKVKSIPVIIFSANRDCEAIAKNCGAEDCLQKPFDIDELLSKVSRLLA